MLPLKPSLSFLELVNHFWFQAAAIDLVREISLSTGEELEIRHYKRLTDLVGL